MRRQLAIFVSSMAVLAPLVGVLPAPTGAAADVAPAAARHVVLTDYRNRIFTAAWVLPPEADAAVLCYRAGGAPATPADASVCSAPSRWSASVEAPGTWGGAPLPHTDFAVFSLATETGLYGPPALVTGETPPPFPAEYLTSHGVSATALDLTWRESTASDANGGWPFDGPGGTVEWVVYGARGSADPVTSPPTRVVAVVPVGAVTSSARIARLDRDATYRFGVRGRDQEGNLSDWSELITTAARRPGLSLVHGRVGGASWRTLRVPAGRFVADAVLAGDTRTSAVHVGWTTYAPERAGYARRSESGAWQAPSLPSGWRALSHLVVGPDHTLTASAWVGDDTCIVHRPPGKRWAVRRCLPPGSWVDGVQLDAAGNVHVVYVRNDIERSTETRYYASDARGRWTARKLASSDDVSLSSVLLGYDRRDDRLVLVGVGPSGQALQVWSKRPAAKAFGTKRSWALGTSADWQVTSVATYAGRVTVAAAPGSGGRPVLLVGRATSSSGTTVRVRGSARIDRDTLLTAVSARRVQMAWTRAVPMLDEERQGVWTSVLRRKSSGRWVTTTPTRRTRSAFDQLEGLVADTAGSVSLLVRRDVDSPFESGDPYS